MNLIEHVEATLRTRALMNSAACVKLEEIKQEVTELAKKVGAVVNCTGGFWYSAPDGRQDQYSGGLSPVAKYYLANDQVFVCYGADKDPIPLEHQNLNMILSALGEKVAVRLARLGRYSL